MVHQYQSNFSLPSIVCIGELHVLKFILYLQWKLSAGSEIMACYSKGDDVPLFR